jgi:hypothetical protein
MRSDPENGSAGRVFSSGMITRRRTRRAVYYCFSFGNGFATSTTTRHFPLIFFQIWT